MIAATARNLRQQNSATTRPFALTDFSQPTRSATPNSFERLKLVECCPAQSQSSKGVIPPKVIELQSAIDSLNAAAAKLLEHRERVLEQAQTETVKLGIAIAERLLRQTLNARPESVLDLIKTSLDSVICAETVRINLHPDDCDLVTNHFDELSRDCPPNIQLTAESKLSRGDCVIEASQGTIDGRLGTILQRISDELLAD